MATTASKQRSSSARRARPATKTNVGGAARKSASKARESASKAVSTDGPSVPSRIARKAAKKVARTVARKTAQAGAGVVRLAADRTAMAGRNVLEAGMSRRPPIQCSLDVAVPLEVAWNEWMTLTALPEGLHRVEDVERDGNVLLGRTAGPRSVEWEAEIVDERENESFAWRSQQGSDCAGLVTFHRLGERLTRVELDLDVLPINPAQALALGLHVGNRRAEAELRRFKARAEFISPDAYETNDDNAERSEQQEDDSDEG